MKLLNQIQQYNNYRYKITDLIEASKEIDVIELKVSDIFLNYASPCKDSLEDFISHCKDVINADLKYPIILSPENFILDGKHRLANAIINNIEYIRAVRFKEMPNCGEYIED